MKYTKNDIYDGFSFINLRGTGATFVVSEITDTKCRLRCFATEGSYAQYNQSYNMEDLIRNLGNGTFIAVTPKTEVYEIY